MVPTMSWNAHCTLNKPRKCPCTQAKGSGVCCNCLAGYFLACFSTAFTEICRGINACHLINRGKLLLNAELFSR